MVLSPAAWFLVVNLNFYGVLQGFICLAPQEYWKLQLSVNPCRRTQVAAASKVKRKGLHELARDFHRLFVAECQNMSLDEIWEEHTRDEFVTRDVNATLATMVEDAYVNHIPVMTGGVGKEQLRRFYSEDFIPRMPPDTKLVPVSRTIGTDQLVDEMIFSFTHTQEMPWMLPGIAPTNKRVEIPLVAIVHFRDGKLAHEHIYWDQASVLKQIGLLDDPNLPVVGVEAAEKVKGAQGAGSSA
jgi:carboxymethylenebutenolidase